MTVAATLLLALAAALVVPPAPPTVGRFLPGAGRWTPGRGFVLAFAAASTGLVLLADGVHLALGLIVLAAAFGGVQVLRRARAARAADHRAALVVEVCEALAGELRAGQPPEASLAHCVDLWSAFDPVATAGRLGADVPAALRRLAGRPGAAGLREVASAWQVSQQSGAGLARALSQVAETARAREATRAVVRGELASAQATARLVALLPVASLAMSAGIGGHPWHFLLATSAGLVCLATGLLCAYAGLWWIDRIAAAVVQG